MYRGFVIVFTAKQTSSGINSNVHIFNGYSDPSAVPVVGDKRKGESGGRMKRLW